MERNIQGNGKIIECMEEVYLNKIMVRLMKVILFKIKNMVKVFYFGKMENNIEESGKMEDSMG